MKTFPKFDTIAFLRGDARRLDVLDGLGATILPFQKNLNVTIQHETLCEIIDFRRYRI